MARNERRTQKLTWRQLRFRSSDQPRPGHRKRTRHLRTVSTRTAGRSAPGVAAHHDARPADAAAADSTRRCALVNTIRIAVVTVMVQLSQCRATPPTAGRRDQPMTGHHERPSRTRPTPPSRRHFRALCTVRLPRSAERHAPHPPPCSPILSGHRIGRWQVTAASRTAYPQCRFW